jgi:hypothetical protein
MTFRSESISPSQGGAQQRNTPLTPNSVLRRAAFASHATCAAAQRYLRCACCAVAHREAL